MLTTVAVRESMVRLAVGEVTEMTDDEVSCREDEDIDATSGALGTATGGPAGTADGSPNDGSGPTGCCGGAHGGRTAG
jgi:hypothetical protein